MQHSVNQQIRQDKENKIKLLLSEFELCKEKIFKHKHDRMEPHTLTQPQPQPKKTHSTAKRGSSPTKYTDPLLADILLKKKVQKVQAQLAENELLFQERENQYINALREEQEKQQAMTHHFSLTVWRLREKAEEHLAELKPDQRIHQRLLYYENKLGYLTSLLQEVQKAVRINQEGQRVEMEDIIKEKLELEFRCTELEEMLNKGSPEGELQSLERQMDQLREELTAKDNTISNIEREFKDEIKQYIKKIQEARASNTGGIAARQELEMLRSMHNTEVEMRKEERQDYEGRLLKNKKRVQEIEDLINSKELQTQREIERLLVENKRWKLKLESIEEEYNTKCGEIQALKESLKRSDKAKDKEKGRQELEKDPTSISKQLENKLTTANLQISRLKEELSRVQLSVERIQKPMDKHQTQLLSLRTTLKSTLDQLQQLKQKQGQLQIIITPPLENDNLRITSVEEENKGLQILVGRQKQEIQQMKELVNKQKQIQIGSQKEIQEKEEIIQTLKSRKVGFENLFLEIEKSNEQLKDHANSNSSNEHNPKATEEGIKEKRSPGEANKIQELPKKKPVQNAIKSSIKDLDIRFIDSDPDEVVSSEDIQENIQQGKNILGQYSPTSIRALKPNLNYSFNPISADKVNVEYRLKELESEVALLTEENDRLTNRKQHLESEMRELENQEDYFIEQKERLKGELATMMNENTTLRQAVRKVLGFLAVDSKSLIKSSIQHFKKAVQQLVELLKDAGQLQKQILTSVESKKGFFSIL